MKSAITEIKSDNNLKLATEKILSNIDEYNINDLILPDGEKEIYEECAAVISCLPIQIIAKYSDELLMWFQDLNWPGTHMIYNTLLKLPVDILLESLHRTLKKAENLGDEEWIYNMMQQFNGILNNNEDYRDYNH